MEDSTEVANRQGVPARGLGTEISGSFAKTGLGSDIPELRGNTIEPASFEEYSWTLTS
jgi:hypothetical protein